MNITENDNTNEWSFKIDISIKGTSIYVNGCLDKIILKGYFDESNSESRIKEYSFDEYLDIKKIRCMKDAISDLQTKIKELNL